VKKTHDHGDRWDESDRYWLEHLLNRQPVRLTYAEVARRLGRTRDAVRSKARRLGLR
jgi:predicted transcriptional regulator